MGASTGTGALPRTTSAANPQVCRSRASPSRSPNTRRKVRSLGTTNLPRSGSRRAPNRARTSCEVPTAHCRIADTESLPTTNVAHAANAKITTSSWRRPRRFRRSTTSRNRVSSDDDGPTTPDSTWISLRARSANWPRTGLIDEDDDTGAAPETNFRL